MQTLEQSKIDWLDRLSKIADKLKRFSKSKAESPKIKIGRGVFRLKPGNNRRERRKLVVLSKKVYPLAPKQPNHA